MDEDLDSFYEETIMQAVEFFTELGITDVHVGGLLRILGTSAEVAAEYDNRTVSMPTSREMTIH